MRKIQGLAESKEPRIRKISKSINLEFRKIRVLKDGIFESFPNRIFEKFPNLEGFWIEEVKVTYCETKLVDSSVLVSLLKFLVLLLECTTSLDEIDQFRFRVA